MLSVSSLPTQHKQKVFFFLSKAKHDSDQQQTFLNDCMDKNCIRTEPDKIKALTIYCQAHSELTCSLWDNDEHTTMAHNPHPYPTPLIFSGTTDPPLSVQCSEDQQPRQWRFHHSGPQCSFHKHSQALGLKGRTCMGLVCVNTLMPVAGRSAKHHALHQLSCLNVHQEQ